MRAIASFFLACLLLPLSSRTLFAEFGGPTDPKAQKTYAEAQQPDKHWLLHDLIDKYKKADKQDRGHCAACAYNVAKLALKAGHPKLARNAAIELEGLAKTAPDQATAHFLHARAAFRMGLDEKKPLLMAEADSELQKVIGLGGSDARSAAFMDGMVLANLGQDENARARFHQYLLDAHGDSIDSRRAGRYELHPELARQTMAPAFALTTLSGERLSLDDLQGKVVLLDFWATWCGPCRQALPRIQQITRRFSGQPLVVLSISLDKDEAKWKEFVAKNHMDWHQYRDGGFDGPLAQAFGVRAIPSTFTIDTDGVLQDQHVGDADIEGKLKKLVAAASHASETRAAANPSGGTR